MPTTREHLGTVVVDRPRHGGRLDGDALNRGAPAATTVVIGVLLVLALGRGAAV